MGSSEAIVQRKADKRLPIVKDFVSVDLAAGPVVKSCDCRRRCRPAAEQTTRTRLSTTQRADVCRFGKVLWLTPVAFNAQRRACKIMQKSRDSSLPCFLRRVRWIDADLA